MKRSLAVAANVKARKKADPLAFFEYCADVQRRFVEFVAQGIETYLRAANKFGKTYVGAALGVALARGMKYLGGVRLPDVPVPNVGIVLMHSYAQSVESVVGAYKRALGEHPFHEGKIQGSLGYIGVIYVATFLCHHGGGEHCDNCSKIYFVSGEGKEIPGAQVDWAHADEPPNEGHWREIRFRSKANRTFFLWITATPLKKRYYQWLKDDFEDCQEIPFDNKVEIVAKLTDNKFLSKKYIQSLITKAKKDPHLRARIYGEYVDVEGQCPFDYEGLQRQLQRTSPPEMYAVMSVLRDGEERLELRTHPRGTIEIWGKAPKGHYCVCIVDPSSGIRDREKPLDKQQRNPAELIVADLHDRRLLLRYNGFMPAAQLGRMARVICEDYNRALFVPETQDGWGAVTLEGFGVDYSNVYIDRGFIDQAGKRSSKIGWRQTFSKRGLIVGALQRSLEDDSIQIPSARALRHLMAVEFDADDRPAEGKGWGPHGETMIVFGIWAYLQETLILPKLEDDISDLEPRERFERALKGPRTDEVDEDSDSAAYGGRWR